MIEARVVASGDRWAASMALLDGAPEITASGASPEEALGLVRVAALGQVTEAARAEGRALGAADLVLAEGRIRSALTLALAQLRRASAPLRLAPDPSGLGTDVSTFPDLDRGFSLITGRRAVAEAVARRWITPRGSLPWAPGVGEDVRQYLSARVDGPRLRALEAALQAQAEGEERVASAAVTVAWSGTAGALALRVRGVLVLVDGGDPLDLVLTVDQLEGVALEVLR